MQTTDEIIELARSRLTEAHILFDNRQEDAAFYLAGYAVELMLKVRICELFDVPNLFDETAESIGNVFGIGEVRRAVKTHNLRALLMFSGLRKKFYNKADTDEDFSDVSKLLFDVWTEQCRYDKIGTVNREKLQKILNGLGSETEGVLKWLQQEK